MTGCETKKKRFNKDVDAQRALAQIRRRPRAVIPYRFYWCHRCNGFHLSSSEPPGPQQERPIILAERFKQYLIDN